MHYAARDAASFLEPPMQSTDAHVLQPCRPHGYMRVSAPDTSSNIGHVGGGQQLATQLCTTQDSIQRKKNRQQIIPNKSTKILENEAYRCLPK
eukprot:2882316-Amphidinium_carterae.1